MSDDVRTALSAKFPHRLLKWCDAFELAVKQLEEVERRQTARRMAGIPENKIIPLNASTRKIPLRMARYSSAELEGDDSEDETEEETDEDSDEETEAEADERLLGHAEHNIRKASVS